MHLVFGWQQTQEQRAHALKHISEFQVSSGLTIECMFSSRSTHKSAVATMPVQYGENN